MSGPNAKKKRAKLEREIEVEDGMGDEFGAFLSDLDRIADVRVCLAEIFYVQSCHRRHLDSLLWRFGWWRSKCLIRGFAK